MKNLWTSAVIFCAILGLNGVPIPEDSQLSFRLDFSREVTAEKALGHAKNIHAKFQAEDENFIAGPAGVKAFVLTTANEKAKVAPKYVCDKNFNLSESTISFYFKVIKAIPGKNVRFFHLFAPSKISNDEVILYSYLDANGNYIFAFQFTDTNKKSSVTKLKLPVDKFKNVDYNRIDVAYNADKASVYINGDLIVEQVIPSGFFEAVKRPRGWSEFMLLPCFPGAGDDYKVRVAIARLRVYPRKISAKEIAEDIKKFNKR